MQGVAHEGYLCGARGGLQMLHDCVLRVPSYIFGFKMGVNESVVLLRAPSELTQFALLHIVEGHWVLFRQVVATILYKSFSMAFAAP